MSINVCDQPLAMSLTSLLPWKMFCYHSDIRDCSIVLSYAVVTLAVPLCLFLQADPMCSIRNDILRWRPPMLAHILLFLLIFVAALFKKSQNWLIILCFWPNQLLFPSLISAHTVQTQYKYSGGESHLVRYFQGIDVFTPRQWLSQVVFLELSSQLLLLSLSSMSGTSCPYYIPVVINNKYINNALTIDYLRIMWCRNIGKRGFNQVQSVLYAILQICFLTSFVDLDCNHLHEP